MIRDIYFSIADIRNDKRPYKGTGKVIATALFEETFKVGKLIGQSGVLVNGE
jgi:hypothetical protein